MSTTVIGRSITFTVQFKGDNGQWHDAQEPWLQPFTDISNAVPAIKEHAAGRQSRLVQRVVEVTQSILLIA